MGQRLGTRCAPGEEAEDLFESHEGTVELTHTFTQAYAGLQAWQGVDLRTAASTGFLARAATVTKGLRKGESVMRFLRGHKESARAYECCWGHYYNCHGTRVGMYCAALDRALS